MQTSDLPLEPRSPVSRSAAWGHLGATVIGAFVGVACGSPGSSSGPGDAAVLGPAIAAPVVGEVVATVDGEPILLSDVEDVARRAELTPLEALRRIEDEALLHQAAVRAGVTADAEDERTVRRAMVQAYLAAEIEARITPESLDGERVAERRARDAALFSQPERRASTHVLARRRPASARPAPGGAAPEPEGGDDAEDVTEAAMARFAARVTEELRAEGDPLAAAARYRDENAEGRTFDIVVETLPPARRTGDLDDAFAGALFALPAPGAVSDPVTTTFGVHVVVLTEIVPPWSAPDPEVDRIVRRQLAVEARAEALIALEDRLLAAHPPMLDPETVARLLSTDLSALRP